MFAYSNWRFNGFFKKPKYKRLKREYSDGGRRWLGRWRQNKKFIFTHSLQKKQILKINKVHFGAPFFKKQKKVTQPGVRLAGNIKYRKKFYNH
jgi:hypothetical protein